MTHDRSNESRTNQVLYCISLKDSENFSASEIIADINHYFPTSTAGKELNITTILNKFCDENMSLLMMNEYTKEYSFVDTKYALCLRAMLYTKNESVMKFDFSDM